MVYGTVYSYNVTFQEMVSVMQTANYLQGNYFDENFSYENVHLFRIEAYAQKVFIVLQETLKYSGMQLYESDSDTFWGGTQSLRRTWSGILRFILRPFVSFFFTETAGQHVFK